MGRQEEQLERFLAPCLLVLLSSHAKDEESDAIIVKKCHVVEFDAGPF